MSEGYNAPGADFTRGRPGCEGLAANVLAQSSLAEWGLGYGLPVVPINHTSKSFSPPRLPPAMGMRREADHGFQKASDFMKALAIG